MDSQKTRRIRALYYLFNCGGTCFFIIGALFKIMHWPGGSMALIIGGALFIVGTVFRFKLNNSIEEQEVHEKKFAEPVKDENGFIRLHAEEDNKTKNKGLKRNVELVRMLGMALLIIGVVLKVMHYPYSITLIISGLVISSIAYVIGEFVIKE